MSLRSSSPSPRLIVNPGLVRVLGSSTEAYLRAKPGTSFELTADTFEFLSQFRQERTLSEVLPEPTAEQLRVIDELMTSELLLPADAGLPKGPPRPPRLPVPRRLCGALPWHDETSSTPNAIVVLGAKYDAGTLERYKKGASTGPDVIREVSREYPLLLGLDSNQVWGFPDANSRRRYLKGVELFDAGDVHTSPGTTPKAWLAGLGAELLAIRERDARALLLGGDHSVTLAAIEALSATRFGVVQFDAHTDFAPIEFEGHIHHANVMRHIHSLPHVEHVVVCGVRGFQQLPDDLGVPRYTSYSVEQLRTASREQLSNVLRPDLTYYATVDVDVLDASIVPGTTVPETDGLRLAELRALLRTLLAGKNIIGADIVEVQGDPMANLTARSALQVAFELIDLMIQPPG
jgi:arginase family enzyme